MAANNIEAAMCPKCGAVLLRPSGSSSLCSKGHEVSPSNWEKSSIVAPEEGVLAKIIDILYGGN